MKKPIPTPLIVGAVVIVLAGVISLFVFGGNGAPEFKPAPPTGKTPDYILNSMSPEQRANIEKAEAQAGVSNDHGASVQPGQNPYAPK